MNDEDFKTLARQRREMKLRTVKDGVSWADRTVPSKTQYKRGLKHRPRTPLEWEELEN